MPMLLKSDLFCVDWDVKPHSLTHSLNRSLIRPRLSFQKYFLLYASRDFFQFISAVFSELYYRKCMLTLLLVSDYAGRV